MSQVGTLPGIARGRSRARRGRGYGLPLWLLGAVLLVEFADISGDFPLVFGQALNTWMPGLRRYTTLASSALIGAIALVAVTRVFAGREFFLPPRVRIFLVLLLASTAWGVAVGLTRGVEPRYVLGDSRNVVVYLVLLAVGQRNPEAVLSYIRSVLFLACAITLVKLAASIASGLSMGSGLSWRYLFKTSQFFLPMLLVALTLYMRSARGAARRRYLVLFLLAVVGLFTAQMRGFFVGLFAGLFTLGVWLGSLKARRRLLGALVLLSATAVTLAVTIQGDVTTVVGHWFTDDFTTNVTFRSTQAAFLWDAFSRHWLLGAGLGWFDPTYEGLQHVDLETLSRPYLKELEYLNLLAKLGVIGGGFLVLAFCALIRECVVVRRLATSLQHRAMVEGLGAGLVAQLVASATNTLYSGLVFHVYVVMVILVLTGVRRAQKLARAQAPHFQHEPRGSRFQSLT